MKRRLTIAALLVCLVGIGAGQAVAQEPPALSNVVGLGGRVEIGEFGFALTFPDDWAWAHDSTPDIGSLVEELGRVTDPAFAHRQRTLLANLEEAFPVIGFPYPEDERQGGSCSGGALRSDESLDEFAARNVAYHGVDDEATPGGATAMNVTLPAGNAARIDIVQVFLPGLTTDSSLYALKNDAIIFIFFCGGDGEPPEDRWLSIAETFEFLPPEE